MSTQHANGERTPKGDALRRVVAYFRKSNEDDGESVGQQREWSRAAQDREGFVVVREFIDQAKSGWKTAARADFAAMLEFCRGEAAAGRPVQAVVCWAPDRFSRADSQETAWFIWEFRKAGTNRMFTQTRGWLDFRRTEHRVLFNVEQDMGAHAYVVNLSQAVLRGRLKSAREGRYLNGAPAFGYVLSDEVKLVPGPHAETVRRLFAEAAQGVSVRALARGLNARSLPSPRGREWTPATVRKILRNPAYLGETHWNRTARGRFARVSGLRVQERVSDDTPPAAAQPAEEWLVCEGTHVPLVDQETFDKVQAVLKAARRGRRHEAGRFPLSGLLVCGHCGRRLCGVTLRRPRKGGGQHAYTRYYCSGYDDKQCHFNAVPAPEFLAAVARTLAGTVFLRVNLLAAAAEIRRQDAEALARPDDRLKHLQVEHDDLARKITRQERRVVEEEDDALIPQQRALLAELRGGQAAVEAELARLRTSQPARPDLDALVEEALAAGAALEEAVATDPVTARRLIELAVPKIELFFQHQPQGRRTRSVFERGDLTVREGFPFMGEGNYDS